ENGICGTDRRVDDKDCRHQADWRSKAERAGFTRLVAGRLIRFDDVERCARAVKSKFAVMALVTDAFGGHGGIAQYNRDFFGAVVIGGLPSSLVGLPRFASNEVVTPAFVRQLPPRAARTFYAVAAIREALFRPIDVVFCGHLFMAPLALLIARLKQAK